VPLSEQSLDARNENVPKRNLREISRLMHWAAFVFSGSLMHRSEGACVNVAKFFAAE
jgi:hypothetical protein